ncbi:Predicted O-linked N-acetylglucosamine transferase, SPINDLY family [Bordetella pertussis]|nr:Predicted O-linked N-acetylglucosamine transferase, SPINDLY family [Bordetella pertussis]
MYEDCAINRTGRVKLSLKHINFGVAALALALAGLQSLPAQAAEVRPRDATGPRLIQPSKQPETEVIRLRPGQLPYVSLTADIFYRIVGAELAAQRGMYGTAAATLVTLARETGDPRLARRGLEFQLAGGNLPGALDAARAWSSLAPNDIEASSTELALAAANGETSGLATALRKRIDTARDKPAAIVQAMGVLSRLNDRRLALRILDESLSDSARKLPAAHLALADVAQAAGDYPRAANEAYAALAADPKSEAAAQRVLEYGAKVDATRAQHQARAFINRNPDARKLRLMLAGQIADGGDYDGALAELQAMSRRSPEDFDLMFMQAQLAYKAGRLDQARGYLQQYLDVQNQRQMATAPGATDAGAAAADAHVLLSRIAEDQGRYDEAIRELGRIDDPAMRYSAHMRQATLRARQGRIDGALAMVDRADPQDDEERTLGVLTKAQILRDADQVDRAVAILVAADKAMPDTVEIKYELAMLYERQGASTSSSACCAKSSRSTPTMPMPTTRWATRWPTATSGCPRRWTSSPRRSSCRPRIPSSSTAWAGSNSAWASLPLRSSTSSAPMRCAPRPTSPPPGRSAVGAGRARQRHRTAAHRLRQGSQEPRPARHDAPPGGAP